MQVYSPRLRKTKKICCRPPARCFAFITFRTSACTCASVRQFMRWVLVGNAAGHRLAG